MHSLFRDNIESLSCSIKDTRLHWSNEEAAIRMLLFSKLICSKTPASFLRVNQSSQRRSISQLNTTFPRQQTDWSRWRIPVLNLLKRKRPRWLSTQRNPRVVVHRSNRPKSSFGFPKRVASDHLFANGTPCFQASPATKANTTIISLHILPVTKMKWRQRDTQPFPTSSSQAIPSQVVQNPLPMTTTRSTGRISTRRLQIPHPCGMKPRSLPAQATRRRGGNRVS